MIECQLCSQLFDAITWTHLKYYHEGVDLLEYRLKFPNAELTSEKFGRPEVSELIAKRVREYWSNLSTEEYLIRCKQNSENGKAAWSNMSEEEKEIFSKKMSQQRLDYFARMTLSEYEKFCRKNSDSKQEYWDDLSPEGKDLRYSLMGNRDKLIGEDSPFWKGGYISTYGYGWSAFREYIQIRDNETCQKCGSTLDLVVHHIDHDTDNIEETNLITLCRSCNGSVNGSDSKDWENLFSERVKEILSNTKIEAI